MTDEATICMFMSPKKIKPWWEADCQSLSDVPRTMSLDVLTEVEKRLSEDQWRVYLTVLMRYPIYVLFSLQGFQNKMAAVKQLVMADKNRKVMALAEAIRWVP